MKKRIYSLINVTLFLIIFVSFYMMIHYLGRDNFLVILFASIFGVSTLIFVALVLTIFLRRKKQNTND